MNLGRNFVVAILMTVVTTILLGIGYPLAVTGLAQVLFPANANGQLIERNGTVDQVGEEWGRVFKIPTGVTVAWNAPQQECPAQTLIPRTSI